MFINENTRVMLRLHKEPNNRGLQIYNPYFLKAGHNAVYLLVYNKNPRPLVEGLRNLNFAGGISAGFEKDPDFIELLDELSDVSQKLSRVGIVVNQNGRLKGHYQGGQGLYQSITTKYGKFKNKKVVILGAGTVARAFLLEMQSKKDIPNIVIVNRTIKNAEKLSKEFDFIKTVKPMSELQKEEGDVFVDTTDIGSPWNKGEDYIYPEKFINGFSFIADVTFVPIEPQLIKMARKTHVDYAPGYRMFLYQAKICLKLILGINPDLKLLEKLMLKDFKVNWS